MRPLFSWGQATAILDRSRKIGWVDLLLVAGFAGFILGSAHLAGEWTGEYRPSIHIDLDDPWVLPQYTFYSLSRGLLAYVISLGFTLVYGYWAAKDRTAERVLVPLLDILQSIPVLSFLPGLVLSLVALFPSTNLGLELASVIMIFTGQAWNMTFSFYHSLRSIPLDQREVADVYRLSWWQRFKWLEVPYSTMGLVWNSMMSMAGGWFFLTVSEAFRLRDRDFRLPGIGSYMSVAVEEGRVDAMLWAILAMMLMIVALDQLLWRPVVVWAQKFRVEEGGHQPLMTSWFLNWLRRSHILAAAGHVRDRLAALGARRRSARAVSQAPAARLARPARGLSLAALLLLLTALVYGGWMLWQLLAEVSLADWGATGEAACWTLCRVLAATAIGTVWAVPAGLAIGLSPRLSRILQPVVQVLASFPAPMLFQLVITGLEFAGVSLGIGSIVLMLLGTQWYILFNVIAGAMAVPADLREMARSYRLTLWQRFRTLYVPAVFPYLVTGWVTAAGGAWNASIVSEYVMYHKRVLTTVGLGAQISIATDRADYPLLAASTLVMSVMVVLFNRLVWRPCYRLAEERFSLNK
jgi:NitT/TauT family transport system permease protein